MCFNLLEVVILTHEKESWPLGSVIKFIIYLYELPRFHLLVWDLLVKSSKSLSCLYFPYDIHS